MFLCAKHKLAIQAQQPWLNINTRSVLVLPKRCVKRGQDKETTRTIHEILLLRKRKSEGKA